MCTRYEHSSKCENCMVPGQCCVHQYSRSQHQNGSEYSQTAKGSADELTDEPGKFSGRMLESIHDNRSQSHLLNLLSQQSSLNGGVIDGVILILETTTYLQLY